MPINAHPDYIAAEGEYHKAQTTEEKLKCLQKMISLAPAHKGAENLRAELKTRYKKLLEKQEKNRKTGKSKKTGIKKEDMQAVIIGFTNSGKSSLLKELTNTFPKVAKSNLEKFTTKIPTIGMMPYESVQIQLIEIPALESEFFDRGTTNTADTIIMLIQNFEEIEKINSYLEKAPGKKIIVLSKVDLLSEEEKRKIRARLQSKKYNFVLTSSFTQEGLDELKEKIFASFDNIRVYTKEPGKEKSKKPIIMSPHSRVKDAAEKLLKGLSSRIKETKIWGPSSKFPGQIVGLSHKLKDQDIVEFKIR